MELIKVIGSIIETVPIETQPADVLHDGVHVLLLFFLRVGIVKAQVGLAAKLVG